VKAIKYASVPDITTRSSIATRSKKTASENAQITNDTEIIVVNDSGSDSGGGNDSGIITVKFDNNQRQYGPHEKSEGGGNSNRYVVVFCIVC
jgi:hypothetical protein